MTTTRVGLLFGALVAAWFACDNAWSTSAEQEDWQAARAASCPELVDAFKVTSAAERKVAAAIKESKNQTIATNVLGVASLAVLGVGFFTWDDHASAEENLADLRHDLEIVKTVAAEKKCALPALDGNAK